MRGEEAKHGKALAPAAPESYLVLIAEPRPPGLLQQRTRSITASRSRLTNKANARPLIATKHR